MVASNEIIRLTSPKLLPVNTDDFITCVFDAAIHVAVRLGGCLADSKQYHPSLIPQTGALHHMQILNCAP